MNSGNWCNLYCRHNHRSRKGGRPRIPDRQVLSGILFVLKTGIGWEDLPKENGLWQWDDLLEAASRDLAPVGSLGAHPLGMP